MKKFWNGVLAFGPVGLLLGSIGGILLVIVVLFIIGMFFAAMGVDLNEAQNNFLGVVGLFMMFFFYGCAFLSIPLCIADIIVFSIYAFKNPKLDQMMKTLWCCAFAGFQFMAFPVYWWIYMRKE